MTDDDEFSPTAPELAPRTRKSEQVLIDAAGDLPASRMLCTSLGRGQFADEYRRRHPESRICCHFLDLYQATLACQAHAPATLEVDGAADGEPGDAHPNDSSQKNNRLEFACTGDFPQREFDLVCLPFTARGDGELTRELLQTAHERLTLGGIVVASTDNPRDEWLRGELKKNFKQVTRLPHSQGIAYRATKTEPLKKRKQYACEFVFRDGERLIRVFSRPSVFSHRRLDTGARALIETMEIQPNQQVLELGCGSGAVSLAAALRAPGVSVAALDANPRAVECIRRGAELNQLSNVAARCDAEAHLETDRADQFDVVLANPPYYSHYRIGEIFLGGAEQALKPGGELFLVTKAPQAYESLLPSGLRHVATIAARQYFVVRAMRN